MLVNHKTVLLRRFRAPWIGLLIRAGFSRDDAEDMVQELSLRILVQSGPRHPRAFWSYWTRALWRQAGARHGAPPTVSLTFSDDSDDELCDPRTPDPARAACVQEVRQRVRAALKAIQESDPTKGDILVRYYLDDQNVSEIAAAHGLTREAVKSQLFEGRKRLRRILIAFAPG